MTSGDKEKRKKLESLIDDFNIKEEGQEAKAPTSQAPVDQPAEHVVSEFNDDLFPEVTQKKEQEELQKANAPNVGTVSTPLPEIRSAVNDLHPVLNSIRENFESLIVAFLMALVIRHYIFEPFQIPTGSMATTLMGRHKMITCSTCNWEWAVNVREVSAGSFSVPDHGRCPHCRQPVKAEENKIWSGEKILANKMAFRFGFEEPHRFQTVVFRPPHKKHQMFIKRLVGMPGETLEVIDGDLHIDGEIAVKPKNIQDTVWVPVYSSAHDVSQTQFFVNEDGGWKRRLSKKGRLEAYEYTNLFDHREHKLVWSRNANNQGEDTAIWDEQSYNGFDARENTVGDLRVDCLAYLDSHEGKLVMVIQDSRDSLRLELGKRCSLIHTEANGKVNHHKIDKAFPQKKDTFVSFQNWDERVLVEFDGEVVLDIQRPHADPTASQASSVWFAAKNSNVVLLDVNIFHDVFYVPFNGRRKWKVDQAGYFMMGDNSSSSEDSRSWGSVPIKNLQGKPWLRLLHVDFPFLDTRSDWVRFGRVP